MISYKIGHSGTNIFILYAYIQAFSIKPVQLVQQQVIVQVFAQLLALHSLIEVTSRIFMTIKPALENSSLLHYSI